MAQCFRDLGEAGHAAWCAHRSLDMDGRYVRGRAFSLSLLASAAADPGRHGPSTGTRSSHQELEGSSVPQLGPDHKPPLGVLLLSVVTHPPQQV